MSESLVPLVIPVLGESISEARIGNWSKKIGDEIQLDETIVELETDKVTIEVNAPVAGKLISQLVSKGQTAKIGDKLGFIEIMAVSKNQEASCSAHVRMISSNETLELEQIQNSKENDRLEKKIPLSTLRLRTAEKLKEAQNTAAILTTFNEVDLSAVQGLRRQFKERIAEKYSLKMGMMPFFIKAAVEGLQKIPMLNSQIVGDQIVHKNYYDIGVAIAASQGLVVPIIRDADKLKFIDIEKAVNGFSQKAKEMKLTLQDLSGGSFTITNGGVFGSLLSTPILNFPQSGILGLHKIQDRPVAIEGRIEIRPMMYIALSYDHRLIDGKEAVSFLVHLKETLENVQEEFLGL